MSSADLPPKRNKSKKPEPPRPQKFANLAEAIKYWGNEAMVSCSECVKHGDECWYDRYQSVACAKCVNHQRKCDGTFSLEELRKVGELKRAEQRKRRVRTKRVKDAKAKLLAARQALMEANKALLEAESSVMKEEDALDKIDSELIRIEDFVGSALRREMLTLGVLESMPEDQQIALGDTDLSFMDSSCPVAGVDWFTGDVSSVDPVLLGDQSPRSPGEVAPI